MTVLSNEDAPTVENVSLTQDEAGEALLNRFMRDNPEEDGASDSVEKDKKVQKEEAAEDTSDEESEDSGDESLESDDETEEEDGNDLDVIEDYKDKYVKIKVDGEERTVRVGDITRLYGQEAALTRKSQEISKLRKKAEEEGAKNVAALAGLITRAQEKSKPYKQIDWLSAAKKLETDDYNALRSEAEQAVAEERYLGEELNGYMQHIQQQRQASLVEKGREAVKELKRDIPGWNEKTYNDVRYFAISSGLDVDIVDNLVDASAIKLIHKAMLYDRGKSGVVTKKKGNAPKKVIKTSKGSVQTKDMLSNKTDVAKAMKKLKESGSKDDAAEAFLARFVAAEQEKE
jgi:hypothetical protein